MESIWWKTCEIEKREALEGEIEAEVAVIGAGMAGILTAYRLQMAGKQVVVLEADRIGGGQTGNTTAKITSQHGLIYHELVEKVGKEKAALYARANEKAIREYGRIVEMEQIDCEFEETNSYFYSQNRARLDTEIETVLSLGLPASFVEKVEVPSACAGAVCFEKQAQFHPLKFLRALAGKLTIYEKTLVHTVEEHRIYTEKGSVRAGQIVFACHFPFVNYPGMYFARMHQSRSYVLALEGATPLDGMYMGDGENAYSFRNYGKLLLFGGAGHRTGENSQGGRYDILRKKAEEYYPKSHEVACWSAQDCMPADNIPYIGCFGSGRPDWYVATGFQKWGMTTSMVAALLLGDMLCGKENPWEDVFDPGRFPTSGLSQIAVESGQAVKGLAKRMFHFPEDTAKDIALGQGGIVSVDGEKVGVYRDETGKLYSVSVRCPHLGCQLEWNPDEKSWDCPCHGSRFDYRGNCLCGPAQTGIKFTK